MALGKHNPTIGYFGSGNRAATQEKCGASRLARQRHTSNTTASGKITPAAPIQSQDTIPIETLIALRSEGKSSAAIAKIVGCSSQNVRRRLSSVVGLIQDVDKYEQIITKQLKASAMQALSLVTPEKLKKSSLSQLGVFAAIAIDKVRLIEGKSTANVAHRVLVKDWSRERASIASVMSKLRGQIAAMEGKQEQESGEN